MALAWHHSADAMSFSNQLTYRGFAAAEYAVLPRHADNPVQAERQGAVKLQAEASMKFSEQLSAAARGYVREDRRNDDRDATRFDELWAQYATPNWDLRVGTQIVTWGSVESVSPLDVINPRDYEEDIVEPIKIGQPMMRFRYKRGGDDLSAYWLPYYEPSRFTGPHSFYSISGGLPVQFPANDWKPEQWALRLFHPGEGFDIGLSWLHGLERNADFDFVPDASGGRLDGRTFPSDRIGVELTKTVDDIVLKAELVQRFTEQPGNRSAQLFALGIEYTLVSVWGHSDLTVFAEYLGCDRGVAALELMQNDLFWALRWQVNDLLKQRTQLGMFWDLDRSNEYVWRLEHSVSPTRSLDLVARYTITRKYYPAPERADPSKGGVVNLLLRYNF